MKIRRKKREKSASAVRHSVSLDLPLEFLALLSATATGEDPPHRAEPPPRKRGRRLIWPLLSLLLIGIGVGGTLHGWGWIGDALAVWVPEAREAAREPVPVSDSQFLDQVVAEGWADRMAVEDHGAAVDRLDRLAEKGPLSAPARQSLEILHWITALDADDAARDGNAGFSIWTDDTRMRERLAFWKENRLEIRNLMKGLAMREVPEPLTRRVYHRFDRLQTFGYRYLADIAALKKAVTEAVRAGRPAQAFPVLTDFRKRHPDLAGVDALRADLEILAEVRHCLREGRMGRVRQIRQTHGFVSDCIAREVERSAGRDNRPPPGMEAVSVGTANGKAKKAGGGPRVRISGLEVRQPPAAETVSFRFGAGESGCGGTP